MFLKLWSSCKCSRGVSILAWLLASGLTFLLITASLMKLFGAIRSCTCTGHVRAWKCKVLFYNRSDLLVFKLFGNTIMACLHVKYACPFASTSMSTLTLCQRLTEGMAFRPIICMCVCVTIDTMLRLTLTQTGTHTLRVNRALDGRHEWRWILFLLNCRLWLRYVCDSERWADSTQLFPWRPPQSLSDVVTPSYISNKRSQLKQLIHTLAKQGYTWDTHRIELLSFKERLHVAFCPAFFIALNAANTAFFLGCMGSNGGTKKTQHLMQWMGSGAILCMFHRHNAKQ